MKKLLSLLLVAGVLGFAACKDEKKADKTEATTPEKVETVTAPSTPAAASFAVAHSCGAECKEGNHNYAHNEVGHTCTEACGTVHACGANCKDGNHSYAHGESGHTCTDACLKS